MLGIHSAVGRNVSIEDRIDEANACLKDMMVRKRAKLSCWKPQAWTKWQSNDIIELLSRVSTSGASSLTQVQDDHTSNGVVGEVKVKPAIQERIRSNKTISYSLLQTWNKTGSGSRGYSPLQKDPGQYRAIGHHKIWVFVTTLTIHPTLSWRLTFHVCWMNIKHRAIYQLIFPCHIQCVGNL